MICPRCDVYCCITPYSFPDEWCPFCGMNPAVSGPAPPPKELTGLAGIVWDGTMTTSYGGVQRFINPAYERWVRKELN